MYVPGTTTPKTTWLDPDQTTANTNPILLDAGGRAVIWGDGEYRQIVLDLNGNLVFDQLTSDSGLSQLQAEITTIEGEITVLQGQVTTLQSDVTTLQGQVATLQSDVATLQAEIAAIPAIPTADLLGGSSGNYTSIAVGSGLTLSSGTLTANPSSLTVGPKGFALTSNGTMTIPASGIKVTLIGGGGGGGAFGGGGAGATGTHYFSGLVVGNTLSVTVGLSGAAGSAGGNTILASGSQTISTLTAGGGQPGDPSTSDGGAGGTISGPFNGVQISGQSGSNGIGGWASGGIAGMLGSFGNGGANDFGSADAGVQGIVLVEYVG